MLGIVRYMCLSGVTLCLLCAFTFNTHGKLVRDVSIDASILLDYLDVKDYATLMSLDGEVKELSDYIDDDIVLVKYAGLETITTEVSTEVTTLSVGGKEEKLVLGGDVVYGSRGVPVGIDTSFKTYMDYKTITCKTSNQYKLQVHSDVYTDTEGFRRYKDCYIVAVGTYYTNRIGTLLEVELSNGNIIKCVVGDIKQDVHTDSLNQHRNGNVLEFIVDINKLTEIVKIMGDVSHASIANLKGNVVRIDVINPLDSDTTVATTTVTATETVTSTEVTTETVSEDITIVETELTSVEMDAETTTGEVVSTEVSSFEITSEFVGNDSLDELSIESITEELVNVNINNLE